MEQHFAQLVDYGFTAQMEEELDEVGAGSLKRTQLLKRFYKRFSEQLAKSKKLASWKPETGEIDAVKWAQVALERMRPIIEIEQEPGRCCRTERANGSGRVKATLVVRAHHQ